MDSIQDDKDTRFGVNGEPVDDANKKQDCRNPN